MAIMAITTSNSIKVNAEHDLFVFISIAWEKPDTRKFSA